MGAPVYKPKPLKCPNCGYEKRVLQWELGRGKYSRSRKENIGKSVPGHVASMRYTCLKCGFHYSSDERGVKKK